MMKCRAVLRNAINSEKENKATSILLHRLAKGIDGLCVRAIKSEMTSLYPKGPCQ